MSSPPAEHGPEEVLPPLYARWMDELLGGARIPAETAATCGDCAMCDDGGGAVGLSVYWDPHVKCCSYLPHLANFLVGGVLLDDGADPVAARGRASVERRIDAGVAVSPLGLLQDPAYMARYWDSAQAFGRSAALLCPHFVDEQGGRCGVWRHREATCVTFFCKHVRGAVGRDFWRTLKLLLRAVELRVAHWCVEELGLDPGALGLGRDAPDAAAAAAEIWGAWAGREREFYRECARRVGALAWADVERIAGDALADDLRHTRDAYARLVATDAPERLRMAPVQLVRGSRGGQEVARVSTYSPIDPLTVPARLADALARFDGARPTDEVIQAIAVEDRLRVSPALVRKLVDFGVLTPADPPPASPTP